MKKQQTLHYQGFIRINGCTISLEENDFEYEFDYLFKKDIKTLNPPLTYSLYHNKERIENGYGGISIRIPNCFVKLYISDNKYSLNEVQQKHLMQTFGQSTLDIYGELFGYSEMTILGLDIINFSIGEHNLKQILQDNEGKYVHLLINYKF